MLSDRTIDEINSQIERELRGYRASWRDEEKAAHLERIAKLRNILEPPAPEESVRKSILEELADAIVAAQKKDDHTNPSLIELIFGYRR